MKSISSPLVRRHRALLALCAALSLESVGAHAATPEESLPAKIVVTDNVVAANPEPFGMNNLNMRWAYNDVTISSDELGYNGTRRKTRYFAGNVGVENGLQYFTNADFGWLDLADGYWNGATAYVYRPVVQPDGVTTYQRMGVTSVHAAKMNRQFWPVSFGLEGSATRMRDGEQEAVPFDEVIRVRSGATSYDYTDGRLSVFYNQTSLDNGVTYYYTVRAIDSGGNWSADANVASATPLATITNGPRVVSHQARGRVQVGQTAGAGGGSKLTIESTGGVGLLTWSIDPSTPLPANLEFGSEIVSQRSRAFVRLKANATATATDAATRELLVRVTDSQNNTDSRYVLLNPTVPTLDPNGVDTTAPSAPTNVQAVAMNGAVRVTWTASASSDVVGYAVLRSRFPAAEQTNRMVLAAGAPVLQPGDFVLLDKTFATVYGNTSLYHERGRFSAFQNSNHGISWRVDGVGGSVSWQSNFNQSFGTGIEYTQVPHPGTKPLAFAPLAGDRCAKVTVPANWSVSDRFFLLKSNNYDRVLEVGKTYRMSLWVYQNGAANNTIKFDIPGLVNKTSSPLLPYDAVVSPNTWTRLDVYITPTAIETNPFGVQPNITVTAGASGATLHYDAFELCEVDATTLNPVVPIYGMMPYWKQELAEFFQLAPGATTKPTLRYWGLQNNTGGGASFDDHLKPVIARRVTGSQDQFSLPDYLALCKDVGADPWIIMSMSHLEEDYANLLEYLAGDGSTTYGALRIQHRGGVTTPWTSEFARIFWECDNESWNPGFKWTFPDGATGYARFAEMLFRHVKSRPLWTTAIAQKVTFVGNGWHTDPNFTQAVGAQSPSTEMVDVAPYLGGWETGSYIGGPTVTDAGFAKWLVYAPWAHFGQVAAHVTRQSTVNATRAAQGLPPYVLGVYEGGPGYSLPEGGGPTPIPDEVYGKSLAAAVTTLDCYLYESYRGYGQQTFFGFTAGNRWASHAFNHDLQSYVNNGTTYEAPRTYGYLRHNNYLAMLMRNRYAAGSMVQTYATIVPNLDLTNEGKGSAQNDVPLVATYAFKQGNRYAVFVLSRRLDERDSGGNVIDPAITPVTLQLPFTSATSVSLHRLHNDPRRCNAPWLPTYDANNLLQIESLAFGGGLVSSAGEFTIDSSSGGVSSTDGNRQGLPAGSIYLYVFEGTTPVSLPANPAVKITRAPTQPAATFRPTMDFVLTFDRAITGLTNSDISLASSTANVSGASITVASLDPLLLDANGNNISLAWKVTVSGVSGTGYVQVDLPAGAVTALSGGAVNALGSGADARVQNIPGSILFDWDISALPNGSTYSTPDSRYAGATPTVERSLPFSDTLPVFRAQAGNPLVDLVPPVYGGIHVERVTGANASLAVLSNVQLARGTISTGSYAAFNGEGGAAVMGSVVCFWPKSAFSLDNPSAPVALNAGSSLSFDIHALKWTMSGSIRDLRFIIRDGSTYYLSEVSSAQDSGTVRLDNFVNNPASRWAAIPSSGSAGFVNGTDSFAEALANASTYIYSARAFNDVQAVGLTGRSRNGNARYIGFTRFTMRTVTDTTPYFAYDIAAPSSTIRTTSVELSASAIDADATNLTYTWTVVSKPPGSNPVFDGGSTTVAAPGTQALKRVMFNANGIYEFRVSVSDGTTTRLSSVITLTVNSPAFYAGPSFTAQPTNKTVTAGGSATFTATVAGSPVPTLQWQRNTGSGWTAVAGATSASLAIANATAADLADYRLVATNSVGTATSNVVSLFSAGVPQNLIARYNFETSGSLGADSSGATTPLNATVTRSAQNGVSSVVPTSPLAPSGTTVSAWTGTAGNHLLVAEPGAAANNLDGFSKMTLSAWVNPGTAGITGTRGVLSKRVAHLNDSAYIIATISGKLAIDIGTTRFNGTDVLSSTGWTHVAVVFDGTLASTTQRMKVYVNGVLQPALTCMLTSVPASGAPFVIGTLQTETAGVPGYTSYYTGQIDDVRVYGNKALTSDEVIFLYESIP